jgi:hypothetical protein
MSNILTDIGTGSRGLITQETNSYMTVAASTLELRSEVTVVLRHYGSPYFQTDLVPHERYSLTLFWQNLLVYFCLLFFSYRKSTPTLSSKSLHRIHPTTPSRYSYPRVVFYLSSKRGIQADASETFHIQIFGGEVLMLLYLLLSLVYFFYGPRYNWNIVESGVNQYKLCEP